VSHASIRRWTAGELVALSTAAAAIVLAVYFSTMPSAAPPFSRSGSLQSGDTILGLGLGANRGLAAGTLQQLGFHHYQSRSGGVCLSTEHENGVDVDLFYNAKARSSVCVASVDEVIQQIEWATEPWPAF
jgi:hypothetical protein